MSLNCVTPSLQIFYHKMNTQPGGEFVVRVPRSGKVADVLSQLAQQLGPAVQGRPLRLMEVHSSKLYKVGRTGWLVASTSG